jgi:hypothetical protein
MQFIGGGGSDYALIASMLNLCCTQRQLKDSFTSNEETIGMHIIDIAEKVVEENLNEEKLASDLVKDPICIKAHLLADRNRKRKVVEFEHGLVDTPLRLDHVELDRAIPSVPTWYACPETAGVEERRPKKRKIGLSMDAGWRKRSSGRMYDYQMGQFLLLEYRQTKSSTTTRCQCSVESASTISSMILCCAHIITPVLQKVWSHTLP